MSLAERPAADDALEAALQDARQRYVKARPRSREMHEAASEHMPGGNTRTVLYHGPFPLRILRGWDAWLEDADGHRYLDLLGEYTAGLYGHSHPVIRAAIEEALAEGLSFGAHNSREVALAKAITARFESIERLRFTNSGTEANLMALSCARAFTGRERILAFDGAYHGGLLYFGGGGSPVNAPYDVVLARYNDTEGAARMIAEQGDALAAVLVEPMLGAGGCIPGEPAFLRALRDATQASGALLILDEVMTSRLGPGGRQGQLGLRPDLTTLGKYLGGGLSFGAFGGRAEVMALFDPAKPNALPHAGTFNNNVLSMAAGLAGLTRVFTPDAAETLSARGDALRAALNDLFQRRQAPYRVTGLGSLMTVHATRTPIAGPEDKAAADDRLLELLFLDLLDEGVYVARRGFVALSLAVTEDQLGGVLKTLDDLLARRAAIYAEQAGA